MFAKCKQEHFTRIEDGADPHGDRLAGNIFLTKKITGCVAAGNAVKSNQSSPCYFPRSRFIEADVSGSPDPQDLDVDPSRIDDCLLILLAGSMNLRFGQRTVGNVDVRWIDIDMIEEVLVHEANVTLQFVRLHWEIFIKIECHYVGQ